MDPVLLLHVEEDFLLPVIFNPSGVAYDMPSDVSRRLWLYFDARGREVDYGFRYKADCDKGDPQCYGDFFPALEKGAQARFSGQSFPYFDLLRLSSALKDLKTLYGTLTRSASAQIPTVYVFAENIPPRSREVFIGGMARHGFAPRSYNFLFTDLVLEYVQKQDPAHRPSFGDTTLVILSDKDRLQLTKSVFDGESWMSDGRFFMVDGFGDAPLKDALVHYVVDMMNRHTGYLVSEEKRREEFEFQRPHADRWLDLPRDADGNFQITDFCFKGQNRGFECLVSGLQLELAQERALGSAIGQVQRYVEEQIGNSLVRIVFCGAAFDDAEVVDMMVRSLNPPRRTILPSETLHLVFLPFMADHGTVEEDFRQYGKTLETVPKARHGVGVWVDSAAQIRDLRSGLQEELRKLSEHTDEDKRHMEEIGASFDARLAVSDFAGARKALKMYQVPSQSVTLSIQTADEALQAVQNLSLVFSQVKGIAGAAEAVVDIDGLKERINKLITASNDREAKLKEWAKDCDRFEQVYDQYKRLKARFNSSRNPLERRDLHSQMSELTREPLPALELPHVTVRVEPKVEVRGKTLFNRGKKFLVVDVHVLDGNELPCEAVVDITPRALLEVQEEEGADCLVFRIGKGIRSYRKEIPVEESCLKAGHAVNLYVFPSIVEIDRAAIRMDPGIVRINL